MDQYKGGKGGERSKWLSIFDNEMFRVDRKNAESKFIPSPYVSIIGSIQPERLELFGEEMGDGLIDRFLTVFPTPVQDAWTDQEVTKEAEEGYERIVEALYDLEFDYLDARPVPTNVSIAPAAREIMKDTYNQLVNEKSTPGFSRRLTNIWQKLETNWLRMVLILSLTRTATIRSRGSVVMDAVTKEDMANSVKLLEFFKYQARMLHGSKRTNTDDFSADLAWFMGEAGGEWEGYTKDLFAELQSEMKAPDVRAFGKQITEVSKRSPLLRLEKKHTNKGTLITLKIVGGVHLLSSCHKKEEEENNSFYISTLGDSDMNGDKKEFSFHLSSPDDYKHKGEEIQRKLREDLERGENEDS